MKKSLLFGLALNAFFSVCVLGCSSSANSATTTEGSSEESSSTGTGALNGVISFNITNARALAGAESTTARNAREADAIGSSALLKILEDGSVESAITVPADMQLSSVSAVFKSSNGTDIFVLFSTPSSYGYWNETSEAWINTGISQLICIHEDGTYNDVLGWDEKTNGYSKQIWCYNSDYANCIKFDNFGNLYYLCSEQTGSNNASVFYKYNPTTNENTQLTAAVSSYSYNKFSVSKDGEYIFVEGSAWTNNSNNSFLRSIPVNNTSETENIVYGNWNFNWVYDDYTDTLFLSENDSEGGLSKFERSSNFTEKQWIKQNETGYYLIYTKDENGEITSTTRVEDGEQWPESYSDFEYFSGNYYNFYNLVATKGGIWGTNNYYSSDNTVNLIKILDSNREYEATSYTIPEGYNIRDFVGAALNLYIMADILRANSPTGYQTLFSIPATGGQSTNIFENVPSSTKTEIISWTISNDGSKIYFSGVKGIDITNAIITTSDLSYKKINSGTKLTCITALY